MIGEVNMIPTLRKFRDIFRGGLVKKTPCMKYVMVTFKWLLLISICETYFFLNDLDITGGQNNYVVTQVSLQLFR